MISRYISITFHETGDVEYNFSRRGSIYTVSRYSIDFPREDVIIHNVDELEIDNFSISSLLSGGISLKWDKVLSDEKLRDLHYTKVGYLEKCNSPEWLFRYREEFRIKGDENSEFSMNVHGPQRKISAVMAESSSVFLPESYGRIHMCGAPCINYYAYPNVELRLMPREMSAIRFYCKGTLILDWKLEIDSRMA